MPRPVTAAGTAPRRAVDARPDVEAGALARLLGRGE